MKNSLKQCYNPYLPNYEYIPDGEPRVFGDRLYVYGSHDRFDGKWFCENDYVLYSAPLSDLSAWTFHGTIYKKSQDNRVGNLYAPDCVRAPNGKYYLYYSKQDSSVIGVAVSDYPEGPFTFLGEVRYANGAIVGEAEDEYFQFDPSVLIDGDKIYLYSGSGQYNKQHRVKQKMAGLMCYELCADMLTVKTGPRFLLEGSAEKLPLYYEGPSARKINGLYYLVFPTLDNSGLHYAVSDKPDGGFVIRNTIHSPADIGINGHTLASPAYQLGNCHGGLCEINGEWYIFDHRRTNNTSFSRQGVCEKVKIEADGSIEQVEATSLGLNGKNLVGQGYYSANIASAIFGSNAYITQDAPDGEVAESFITNITSGTVVGFKYFDLLKLNGEISIDVKSSGKAKVTVLDGECGNVIAEVKIQPSSERKQYKSLYNAIIAQKTALYFQFEVENGSKLEFFGFEIN